MAAQSFIDYARQAAQKAGLDPDLFVRQIQQESGFDPNALSPAGARGIAQIVPQYHPGVDTSDPYASLDYAAQLDAANLKKFGNTRDMLVAYNAGPGRAGLPDAQLPAETRTYLSRVLGGTVPTSSGSTTPTSGVPTTPAGSAPQSSATGASPLASMLLRGGVNPLAVSLLGGGTGSAPSTASAPAPSATSPAASGKAIPASGNSLSPNQFGDATLTPDEAAAACGPAAAVAFARAQGRAPTLREALDLAKQVGWTPQGGMNGMANQKKLLDKMNIPSTMVAGAHWDAIQQAASSGTPVSISTPNHYFVADGYDPKTGKYHVGNSGLAFKAGADWLSQQDIEKLGGGVNGALFLSA